LRRGGAWLYGLDEWELIRNIRGNDVCGTATDYRDDR